MIVIKKKYYDLNHALTYQDKLYYFIVGARNLGKSYTAKKYVIKQFLKHDKQFIYLRRYKTELKKKYKFFNDIKLDADFVNVKFEVKGNEFYINDKLAGTCVNLSTQGIEKSTPMLEVETIIFDEFLIDPESIYHYLPNDPEQFKTFYDSVDRLRDVVKVFFLANAFTFYNPYFLYYDLKPPKAKNGIYAKKLGIYLEVVDENQYGITEVAEKSISMRMHENTEYYDHAVHNVFISDDDQFIKTDYPGNIENLFNIKSNGKTYGIWVDYSEGYMYVRSKFDPSKTTFTTYRDHQPNTLIFNVTKSKMLKNFKDAFLNGLVYFDSQKTYGEIYKTIKKLI